MASRACVCVMRFAPLTHSTTPCAMFSTQEVWVAAWVLPQQGVHERGASGQPRHRRRRRLRRRPQPRPRHRTIPRPIPRRPVAVRRNWVPLCVVILVCRVRIFCARIVTAVTCDAPCVPWLSGRRHRRKRSKRDDRHAQHGGMPATTSTHPVGGVASVDSGGGGGGSGGGGDYVDDDDDIAPMDLDEVRGCWVVECVGMFYFCALLDCVRWHAAADCTFFFFGGGVLFSTVTHCFNRNGALPPNCL